MLFKMKVVLILASLSLATSSELAVKTGDLKNKKIPGISGEYEHRQLNMVYSPTGPIVEQVIAEQEEILDQLAYWKGDAAGMLQPMQDDLPPNTPYAIMSDFAPFWPKMLEIATLQIELEQESLDLVDQLGGVPEEFQSKLNFAKFQQDELTTEYHILEGIWKLIPDPTGTRTRHRQLNGGLYVPTSKIVVEVLKEQGGILEEIEFWKKDGNVMLDPRVVDEGPPLDTPYAVKDDFAPLWPKMIQILKLQIELERGNLDLVTKLGGVEETVQQELDLALFQQDEMEAEYSILEKLFDFIPETDPEQ